MTRDGLVAAVVQQHDTGEVLWSAGWTTRRCAARSASGPGDVLVAQPAGVLAQGRHERPRPAGQGGRASTATATRCSCGRPGRRGLPHRRPHLLRRARLPAVGHRASRATVRAPCLDWTVRPSDTSRACPATARRTRPGRTSPAFQRRSARAPPRHPGRAPAAGRRRDAGRGLPQARQGRPGHVPARVRRARRASGRATRSSAPRSRATLTERDGQAHWIGEPPVGVPTDGDPARRAARHRRGPRHRPIAGLPPLTGGMVGAITYDAVRRWEKVPDGGRDELDLPEIAMMLATDLAVSTTPTARCCSSPTPSTTTRPTSGSRTPGPTPSPGSTG